MSSTAVAVTLIIGLVVIVGIVVRARANRPLTTEEIVRLMKRIHTETGVDPTKPRGFTVQPNGTWVPIQRDR